MLRKLEREARRIARGGNKNGKASAQAVAQVQQLQETVDSLTKELSLAEKHIERIDRIASLVSAGKEMAASAVVEQLEQWNYPRALEFVLSKAPKDEVSIDFSSLDQEECEAVVKGVLHRCRKILDALEDADGVEAGAVKDLKKGIKWCKENKSLLIDNLAVNGALSFSALQIENKTFPETTETSQPSAVVQHVAKEPEQVAPHPGLVFSKTLQQAKPYIEPKTAVITENQEQNETQGDAQVVRMRVGAGS